MTQPHLSLIDPWDLHPVTGQPPFADYPYAQAWSVGDPGAMTFFREPTEVSGAPVLPPLDPFRWTEEEVQELEQFNRAAGNGGGAHLARLLLDPETRTVVTGQQPNLLAAPLYNTAKARAVIRDGGRWTAETGRTVVPIFWVASDDADFSELRTFDLADARGHFHRLGRLVSRGAGRRPGSPASEWVVGSGDRDRLIQAAAEVLDGQPGKDRALAWMNAALAPLKNPDGKVAPGEEVTGSGASVSFEVQFIRALMGTMDPEAGPLLFVVPRLQGLRRAALQIALRDIDLHGPVAGSIVRAGEQFQARGWTVPLFRAPDALNFFWHQDGLRLALRRREGDTYEAVLSGAPGKKAQRSWTRAELEQEITVHPEQFSPGVVTRPIVQDYALRPYLYTGGPGEVAYLAQIHASTAVYGVQRSLVALRPAIVVARDGGDSQHSPSPEATVRVGMEKLRQLSALRDQILQQITDWSEGGPSSEYPAVGLSPRSLEKTLWSVQTALDRLGERFMRQQRLWPLADNIPGAMGSGARQTKWDLGNERQQNWVGLLSE
jgi:hypothetical protein